MRRARLVEIVVGVVAVGGGLWLAAAYGRDRIAFDPFMSTMCSQTCAAPPDIDPALIELQPGVHDGQYARCPVSGVVFEVDGARPRVAVGNATYVVCCDGCKGKLESHPERFVKL